VIVIPAIDLRNGKCVRLHQGRLEEETVYGDDPVATARQWAGMGAKRLHLVDLDGAFAGKPAHAGIIKEIAAAIKIPVEVGGGIRNLDAIRDYLEAGVERVILGSVAIQDPGLVKEACDLYPGRVMVGIDAKNGRVAVKGWVDLAEKSALELAGELKALGVGEIVYTDISRDGTLEGPNLPALTEMVKQSGLKVIASGGISGPQDLVNLKGLGLSNISGVIIGKALYDRRLDLKEAIRIIEEES
jgi:phosphoribosylformimino-5-aminoimidazole carboxamide ribotide isomerase